MERIVMAGPLLPGKEEPWRRFVQELAGSRAGEYEEMKRRLGIQNETMWLMRVPRDVYRGELVFVRLEAAEPEKVLRRLKASEHPFDLWLKDRLMEFHSYSLSGQTVHTRDLPPDGRQAPIGEMFALPGEAGKR